MFNGHNERLHSMMNKHNEPAPTHATMCPDSWHFHRSQWVVCPVRCEPAQACVAGYGGQGPPGGRPEKRGGFFLAPGQGGEKRRGPGPAPEAFAPSCRRNRLLPLRHLDFSGLFRSRFWSFLCLHADSTEPSRSDRHRSKSMLCSHEM